MRLKKFSNLYRTTSFRLTIWYAGVFVLTSLVSFSLSYFLLYSAMKHHDHQAITDKAAPYEALYRTGGESELVNALTSEHKADPRHMYFVRLTGEAGKILFQTSPQWHGFAVGSALPQPGRTGWQTMSKPDYDELLDIYSMPLDGGHILQVGNAAAGRNRMLSMMSILFTATLLLSILVAFPTSLFLANRAFLPLRRLNEAMRSTMNTGKMRARVPVAHSGEDLDDAGILFNALMDKIELLITKLGESLDNTAHDLRTPLTRLRNTAETALQSGNIEECQAALSDCMEESEQVLKILNVVMDIAEAETGTMKLHPETVDMAELLDDVTDIYRYVFEDKNVAVSVRSEGDLHLVADRVRLQQVLGNLLDNAIKYTPSGGNVAVNAALDGDAVKVVFKDDGMGIPREDLPKIWDRLYRCDKSHSTRGLGLGLSLVKAIVTAHKGTIKAESKKGEGSTFTLRLPLTQQLPSPEQLNLL